MCRTVNVVPELYNLRIGLPPRVDDVLQFGFLQTVFQCAHADQSTDRTAIPAPQLCLLAFLPLRAGFGDVFHGNVEHIGGGRFINLAMRPKNLHAPFLSRQPAESARFNRRKIRHNEPASFLWHKRRADELGKHLRRIAKEILQRVKPSCFHKIARNFQRFQMVLRQILHLNQAGGKPSRVVRSVEQKQPSCPAVLAHCPFAGFVFLYGRFRQLLPELEHFQNLRIAPAAVQFFYRLRNCFFGQAVQPDTPRFQPALELGYRVWIFQSGQFICPRCHLLAVQHVTGNCLTNKRKVYFPAAVIDALIHVIERELRF